MVSLSRCLLTGLVALVPMTIVWVTVVTTATYRSLELSAQVLFLTRKLQVSNLTASNWTWELNWLTDSHTDAYSSSTEHPITGTHDNMPRTTSMSSLASTVSYRHVKMLNKSSQTHELLLRWSERPPTAGYNDNSTAGRRSNNGIKVLKVLNLTSKLSQNSVESEPTRVDDPTKVQLELLTRLSHAHNFTLPYQPAYKPVTAVFKTVWVKQLTKFLSQCKSKQVTLVIANTAYKEILLNWLISATIVSKPPVENILVAALDLELHDILNDRGLDSIWVAFSSILNLKHYFKKDFEHIMMVRLGLMRLINYFGYDCAMYDIDAIMLRNPQQLYTQYQTDIVSSRGSLPKELMRKWHVTMCIGAVFIRSNHRTEEFWKAMSRTHLRTQNTNDQIRLNHGLDALGITWKGNYRQDQTSEMYGLCRNNLTVTVLPFKFICRYGCRSSMRNQYYIWHQGGNRDQDSKMAGAAKGHTWFLREDWKNISESNEAMKGLPWLHSLSVA